MKRAMTFLVILLIGSSSQLSLAQGWQDITPGGLSAIHHFRTIEFYDGSFALYVWDSNEGFVTNGSLLWDSIQTRIASPCIPAGETYLVDVARPYARPDLVLSSFLNAGGCSIECYLFMYRDTTGRVTGQHNVGSYDDFLCAGAWTRAVFSRSNPNECYFTFYDSVYRSTDGGSTFRSISVPDSAEPYQPLSLFELSPHDSNVAFSANFQRTYRSSDRGNTWVEILNAAMGAIEFHPTNQQVIYALIDSSIYKSTNAGELWSILVSGSFTSLEISKEDPDILFAGTQTGGLFKSTNAGSSWTLYNNTFATLPIRGLYHLSGDTVIVCSVFGVFKVFAPFTVGVEEDDTGVPKWFELCQNYPNPFNPYTNFEFRISKSEFVSLKVYDPLGREVATLVNGVKHPRDYQLSWDATGMSSGVYFYRMTAGAFVQTRKLVLLK